MNLRRLFHKILRPSYGAAALTKAKAPPGRSVATFLKEMGLGWLDSPEQTNRWPAQGGPRQPVQERTGATQQTKIRRKLQELPEEQWVFTVNSGMDRGRRFIGATPEIKMGRQPDNHIQLRDPKVSRFHAVIHQRGSQLYLEDLRSTNGTFLNGEPLGKQKRLMPGDQIKIGETVIEVSRDGRVSQSNANRKTGR